jgi:L-aminopeptidase/D-esterase-like protein
MKVIHLSEIEGFSVGHAENHEFKTGCTAILCPAGATASVNIPGFATSTREENLLDPCSIIDSIHGLLFAGGSAFGLNAAGGVVRYLRDIGSGYLTDRLLIPTVPAATVYDFPFNLSRGDLPNEAMGYEAARNATTGPLRNGRHGAGYSVRSGTLSAHNRNSESGIGSYGIHLDSGLQMAALAVVNPIGSVVDPHTGSIVSGVRHPDGTLYTRQELLTALSLLPATPKPGTSHTVLVALATNAKMDMVNAKRLALMATSGISRAIFPAHILYEGDAIFAMSSCTGEPWDISFLGALGSEVVSQAILRSVPAYHDK